MAIREKRSQARPRRADCWKRLNPGLKDASTIEEGTPDPLNFVRSLRRRNVCRLPPQLGPRPCVVIHLAVAEAKRP